jgi:hypothetical protein
VKQTPPFSVDSIQRVSRASERFEGVAVSKLRTAAHHSTLNRMGMKRDNTMISQLDRRWESGLLTFKKPLIISLISEGFPVWLLILDPRSCLSLHISHVKSMEEFVAEGLKWVSASLLHALIQRLGTELLNGLSFQGLLWLPTSIWQVARWRL